MNELKPSELEKLIYKEVEFLNEDLNTNEYNVGNNGYGISLYKLQSRVSMFEISYKQRSKKELRQLLSQIQMFRGGIEVGIEVGKTKTIETHFTKNDNKVLIMKESFEDISHKIE